MQVTVGFEGQPNARGMAPGQAQEGAQRKADRRRQADDRSDGAARTCAPFSHTTCVEEGHGARLGVRARKLLVERGWRAGRVQGREEFIPGLPSPGQRDDLSCGRLRDGLSDIGELRAQGLDLAVREEDRRRTEHRKPRGWFRSADGLSSRRGGQGTVKGPKVGGPAPARTPSGRYGVAPFLSAVHAVTWPATWPMGAPPSAVTAGYGLARAWPGAQATSTRMEAGHRDGRRPASRNPMWIKRVGLGTRPIEADWRTLPSALTACAITRYFPMAHPSGAGVRVVAGCRMAKPAHPARQSATASRVMSGGRQGETAGRRGDLHRSRAGFPRTGRGSTGSRPGAR